jgi:hypothetical protein
LFLSLRISRIQLKRKRIVAGAESFVRGVNELFDLSTLKVSGATLGGSVFASLPFAEPALSCLSDAEFSEFFNLIESRLQTAPQARAWLLFREGDLLFDRMLVQKGKSKLAQAEGLATDCGAHDLLFAILHKKLFSRSEQTYSTQIDWMRDVFHAGLLVANTASLASNRDSLGNNVYAVTTRSRNGPMKDVGQTIGGFGERWAEDRFLFALLAVYQVAQRQQLKIDRLAEIGEYLRNVGSPINTADFA